MIRIHFTKSLMLASLLTLPTFAQDVTLSVAVDRPVHPISPRLYGIFLEDINFGADGGLNAELVKNGGFEFPDTLMGWRKLGDGGEIRVAHSAPRRASNSNYLELRSAKSVAVANEGFRGIGVHQGDKYEFTAWARTDAGKTAKVVVRLVGQNEQVLAEAQVEVSGSDWQDLAATLTPTATEARRDSRLRWMHLARLIST